MKLHKANNADLIEYIEKRKQVGDKTSEVFKEGIVKLISDEEG